MNQHAQNAAEKIAAISYGHVNHAQLREIILTHAITPATAELQAKVKELERVDEIKSKELKGYQDAWYKLEREHRASESALKLAVEALDIQRLVLLSIASGGCEGSTVCIKQQDVSCCSEDSGVPKDEWCVPCRCSRAITAAEKLLEENK